MGSISSVESITREREKEEVAESIRLQSSEHLTLPIFLQPLKRNTRKASSQDVYSKSQPSWVFVCHQPGKVINQTSASATSFSFSILKTNRRHQPDPPPPPETICDHEMYF